ncbi:MAG TPA: hypothetical protein VKT78_07885, partial [Fimbriimonadaceae bacterium]|nr:hypothetical protein [Fimbriimonadaceae bacterium]
TSCGIYGSNGKLVRTLWGSQATPPGSYSRTWDGNDDLGNPVAPDNYTAKILSNNVTPVWNGTIGNTSVYQTGPSHLSGLANIADAVAVGTKVYLLRTYNELGEYIDVMDRGAPNIFNTSGAIGGPSAAFEPTALATDGTYMYTCARPVPMYTSNPNYVIAAYNLDEVSGALVFSNIPHIPGYGPGQNANGAWIVLGSSAAPSSIAVQKSGAALAVAQNGTGLIQLFDKRGGQPLPGGAGSFNEPGVVAIRWSTDERTLWTAAGNNVDGWQFTGSSWSKVTTIPGTNPVHSFAVNPADGSLGVLYGGTDQQLRAFTPQGTWLYSIGSRGGYKSSPTVNDTKFMIPPDYFNGELMGGGVCYEDDGKVWIEDFGNSRLMRYPVSRHLSSARKDALVSLITGYMGAVDKNNSSRIFIGYMEFNRNYTYPLSAGPGVAWTLVNNWGYGYWMRDTVTSTVDGITNVVTASNGHTYAIMQPADCAPWQQHLVELTSSGARDIQVFPSMYLEPDMSAWTWTGNGGPTATFWMSPLQGFQNNNPVWGAQTQYCSMSTTVGNPVYHGGFMLNGNLPIDRLPDGSIPTFSTDVGVTSYSSSYLGFIKQGATDWWAKTARGSAGTPLLHDGTVPVGSLGNTKLIPDIGGRALGNIVAVFCNGEFFDSAESNQILLYDGSGLPLTDFGTRLDLLGTQPAPSGKAGNFYGNAFVMGPDGNPRVFTSDEAAHAGFHEWELLNTSSIQLSTAAFDGTNTANFGAIGLMVKASTSALGHPDVVAQSSPIVITDTFNRTDSTSVGNGWQDPNGIFTIAGARLKEHQGLYDQEALSTLIRPETNTESDQTITIPVQLFDPTKMAWNPQPSYAGRWGLFSRLQASGSRYFAEFNYLWTPNTQSSGTGELVIGMLLNGQKYVLGYDHCLSMPTTPGHSYSIEFQTTGMAPTHLHCVMKDTTTGTQYAVLDQYSDEPEFQNVGLVGIQGGMALNEFTSYSATLSTITYQRRGVFRP